MSYYNNIGYVGAIPFLWNGRQFVWGDHLEWHRIRTDSWFGDRIQGPGWIRFTWKPICTSQRTIPVKLYGIFEYI